MKKKKKAQYLLCIRIDPYDGAVFEDLSIKISRKFDIKDPHAKIVPHLTLKYPFEATELEVGQLYADMRYGPPDSIYHTREFAKLKKPFTITLDTIGAFDRKIVYVGTSGSKKAFAELASRVLDQARLSIPHISANEFDPVSIPHVTLAWKYPAGLHEDIFDFAKKHYWKKVKVVCSELVILRYFPPPIGKWKYIVKAPLLKQDEIAAK